MCIDPDHTISIMSAIFRVTLLIRMNQRANKHGRSHYPFIVIGDNDHLELLLWLFGSVTLLCIYLLLWVDNDCRPTSTSPTLDDREPAVTETGSSWTKPPPAVGGLAAERDELEVDTEFTDRSSLSSVDDEATTSRLELFQISALTDSYEADQTTNLSVEEESIVSIGDALSVG